MGASRACDCCVFWPGVQRCCAWQGRSFTLAGAMDHISWASASLLHDLQALSYPCSQGSPMVTQPRVPAQAILAKRRLASTMGVVRASVVACLERHQVAKAMPINARVDNILPAQFLTCLAVIPRRSVQRISVWSPPATGMHLGFCLICEALLRQT